MLHHHHHTSCSRSYLSSTRVWPEDGAEPTLSWCVPEDKKKKVKQNTSFWFSTCSQNKTLKNLKCINRDAVFFCLAVDVFIPELQLHSPPIQKNGGGFIVDTWTETQTQKFDFGKTRADPFPFHAEPERLTAAVGIGRLSWSVLQTVQDLPFTHVTVSHQEELEQVVVAFYRASLAAHDDHCSHPGPEHAEPGNVQLSSQKVQTDEGVSVRQTMSPTVSPVLWDC